MRCPHCSQNADRVIETREISDSSVIRRRRTCEACGARFTTYERAAPREVLVLKRDGRTEPFDRQKLVGGIQKACANRPIPSDVVDSIAQDIEDTVLAESRGRVTSKALGDAVLERLAELDGVAYMRFASVYKRFGDPTDFFDELDRLGRLVGTGLPGQSLGRDQ